MSYLPTITKDQLWCCSRGCGDCKAKESQFEYSRTEHLNGDVESLTHRVFVSDCCGVDLMLWDDEKQDFVGWDYVATPAASVSQSAKGG